MTKPADMTPEQLGHLEWKHVAEGFKSCKQIMEAQANGVYSWLPPLIQMAEERAFGIPKPKMRAVAGKIKQVVLEHEDQDRNRPIIVRCEIGGQSWGTSVSQPVFGDEDSAKFISDLMLDAGVTNLLQLQGKPIWCIIDDNIAREWGILKDCV